MSIIIDRIKARLKDNMNYVGVVIGKVRLGKSYTAIKFCMKIDPTFADDIENRCFFTIEDFIHCITSHDKEYFKGKAFILDEGGVAIGHRQALSRQNKAFADLLNSWGYLNSALFITSPSLSFLDKTARGMMLDGVFRIVGHNKKQGFCYVKVYDVKGNPFTGDGVRPFPHRVVNGEKVDIEGIRVSIIPPDIGLKYDKLSWEAKKKISLNAEYKLKEDERKTSSGGYHNKKREARKLFREGMSKAAVSREVGVSYPTAWKWLRDVKQL